MHGLFETCAQAGRRKSLKSRSRFRARSFLREIQAIQAAGSNYSAGRPAAGVAGAHSIVVNQMFQAEVSPWQAAREARLAMAYNLS
jgi:hypothetical protein